MRTVEQWRQSIPWNNAQIEIALRDKAKCEKCDFVRSRLLGQADHLATTGRFTQKMLNNVLDRLVKTCGICGAKALYRYGYAGRCIAHKHVMSTYAKRRSAMQDAKSQLIQEERRSIEGNAINNVRDQRRAMRQRMK